MDMNLCHLVHGGQGRPRPPPLPLRRVLEVTADVAAGLALLHPTIVHRCLGREVNVSRAEAGGLAQCARELCTPDSHIFT